MGATSEEGIYVLENRRSPYGEVLNLSNGNWGGGPAQLWDPSNDSNTNASRNQRYLITLVPGDNNDLQYYHITNLFYGVQLGVYAGAYDSIFSSLYSCFTMMLGTLLSSAETGRSEQVRAAPCTTGEWKAQWGLIPVGPDFSIYWRSDNECYMASQDGRHGKVYADSGPESDNQLWHLQRLSHYEQRGTAAWMSHIRSNPRLSMLNLVGTHQSFALHAKGAQGHQGPETRRNINNIASFNILDNPRCQNRSPYEQLVDGIRVFDFRFHCWTNNKNCAPSLYAWHGQNSKVIGAAEGYSFTAVLQSLKLFLGQFSRETVIISVRNETGVDARLFEECFWNDFRDFEWLFYHRREGKESIHQINLDDARGKAILLSQDLPTSIETVLHTSTFYGGHGATHHNEGRWDLPPKTWHIKLRACEENIVRARSDEDEKHVYTTSWNMSNAITYPPYNPIDFYFGARETIVDVFRRENIGVDGRYRTGIIMFDFYELLEDETLAIVRSNVDCGDIKRSCV